jgi:hypothetical protein
VLLAWVRDPTGTTPKSLPAQYWLLSVHLATPFCRALSDVGEVVFLPPILKAQVMRRLARDQTRVPR